MKVRVSVRKQKDLFAAKEIIKHLALVWPAEYSISQEKLEGQCNISLSSEDEREDYYSFFYSGLDGCIKGSNQISLLIGCYRFLSAIGFFFPAPGITIIPKNPPSSLRSVSVREESRASFRHRGVAIEGANTIENVISLIDWLPKAGYNTYFLQFDIPHTFFARWYQHEENPLLEKEEFTKERAIALKSVVETAVKERGMLLHSVGHGWTSRAMGMDALGWEEEKERPEDLPMAAEIDGKRRLFGGIAINTNLCYSEESNIRAMVDVILEYAMTHKQTDVLHLWLADGWNNFCECPKCKDKLPADQYVRLLNAVDKAFSENGIETKICFLIYFDLLWPAECERILNPERFIMMFAPISRSFESSYMDAKIESTYPEYRKNRITAPAGVGENLAFLKSWQKRVLCDSFDFDYHLGKAHNGDPGHEKISRIISEDIRSLSALGLNGYISCQEQRAAFPTGLPNYIMGQTLWDSSKDFDALADSYYSHAFSLGPEETKRIRKILSSISYLFDMDFFKGSKKGSLSPEKNMTAVSPLAEELREFVNENIGRNDLQQGHIEMWRRLSYLPEYISLFSRFFFLRAKEEDAKKAFEAFSLFAQEHELELQEALDVFRLVKTAREYAGFDEQG